MEKGACYIVQMKSRRSGVAYLHSQGRWHLLTDEVLYAMKFDSVEAARQYMKRFKTNTEYEVMKVTISLDAPLKLFDIEPVGSFDAEAKKMESKEQVIAELKQERARVSKRIKKLKDYEFWLEKRINNLAGGAK